MLKIILRFITLVFFNYLVINFSVDIDLEQLVKDFQLINIFLLFIHSILQQSTEISTSNFI
mgnify:CR=1 FL=1